MPAGRNKPEPAAGFYQPAPESAASTKVPPEMADEKKDLPPQTRVIQRDGPQSRSDLPPLGGAQEVVRGRKNMTADLALGIEDDPLLREPDSLEAEIARIEKSAKPFGALTQKLALPPVPGYYVHWFNDDPGRIDEQLERGWTSVKDSQNRPVKRIVGRGRTGGGLYAYALKIPQVFRDREMARRHAEAKARIGEMKRNPIPLREGQAANPQDKDKFYSPGPTIVSVKEPAAS